MIRAEKRKKINNRTALTIVNMRWINYELLYADDGRHGTAVTYGLTNILKANAT